jgi:hypothetical protein
VSFATHAALSNVTTGAGAAASYAAVEIEAADFVVVGAVVAAAVVVDEVVVVLGAPKNKVMQLAELRNMERTLGYQNLCCNCWYKMIRSDHAFFASRYAEALRHGLEALRVSIFECGGWLHGLRMLAFLQRRRWLVEPTERFFRLCMKYALSDFDSDARLSDFCRTLFRKDRSVGNCRTRHIWTYDPEAIRDVSLPLGMEEQIFLELMFRIVVERMEEAMRGQPDQDFYASIFAQDLQQEFSRVELVLFTKLEPSGEQSNHLVSPISMDPALGQTSVDLDFQLSENNCKRWIQHKVLETPEARIEGASEEEWTLSLCAILSESDEFINYEASDGTVGCRSGVGPRRVDVVIGDVVLSDPVRFIQESFL